jgi:hypothetical protein
MRKKLNPAKTRIDLQPFVGPHSFPRHHVVIINPVELNILIGKRFMKPLDSIEKKTLLELLRMFADPALTAKRYSRYAKMCWAGVFACAIAAGVVGAVTQTDDAKMILMLFSGIFIGLALYFGNSSKQVAIMTHYCSLNVEAAQQRLSEEKK